MDIMYLIGTDGRGGVALLRPASDGDGHEVIAARVLTTESDGEFVAAVTSMLEEVVACD